MTPPTLGNEAQRTTWIEAAFGGLGLAMLTTNAWGIITLVNEKASRILGVDADEAVGKPLVDVIGIWDATADGPLDFPLQQVLDKGLRIATDSAVLLEIPSGEKLCAMLTVAPMHDEEGGVLGAVMTISQLEDKDLPCHGFNPVRTRTEGGRQRRAIFVRSGGRYIRVMLNELLWVEAMENYVQFQTTKEKLVVHATLKSIAETLLSRGFRRIHRSFIVRTDAIESIEENHVRIHGTALPIGKSFRSELLEDLTLI